ncbi:MICALL1 [Lepeophtheirus salmonis]|uniref:MICALL1 n=1 Tax=Lepeophtheirus salmonis TaxID=72036 RepID=A0A7R8H066_LEPSM|nr:MICALL1 [Lepeophtheirus salmonis]CAF2778507.1 MICALL1 [Lepeophtheirus salmonis]
MAVLHGTKALEAWCQIVTKDYSNVTITNMTSSWRSGLGFCALIHHFRPRVAKNYSNLNPQNAFENNSLAFTIAEQHLGINALLDPADMVHASSLDRLSILTYLSQFYQAFGGATTRSHVSNHVKSPFIKPMPRRESSSAGGPCQFCQKPLTIMKRKKTEISAVKFCPDEEVSQVQLALTNKLKRESQEKELNDEEISPSLQNKVEIDILSSSTIGQGEEEENSESIVQCEEEEHEEKLETFSTQEKENIPLVPEESHLAENDIDSSFSNEKTVEEIHSNVSSDHGCRSSSNRSSLHLENTSSDHEVIDVNEKNSIEDKENEISDIGKISQEESKSSFHEDKNDENIADFLNPDVLVKEKEDLLVQHEENADEIKEGIAEVNSEETRENDEPGVEEKSSNKNNEVEDDSQEKVLAQEKVCNEEPCDYPEDLNPFDLEDGEELVDDTKAIKEIENKSKSESSNPFGSDFEDEENDQSLNPFGSDLEDSDGDDSRFVKTRRAPMPPGAKCQSSPSSLLRSNNPKSLKERDNINRRSQISNLNFNENKNTVVPLTPVSPDKADGGIWKKKKGPAPPRPIPPKRQVKKIPRKAVNTELIDIEVKTTRKENGTCSEDRELEEEHADLEYQIRVLMNKENLNEDQKKEEEGLISRLMYVVSQRNEIVDCLEMDRLRELEEDESIEIHMGEFAAVKPALDSSSEKKKKKKNKEKKNKNKSFDVDKDIDTKEFPNLSQCGSPKPSPKKDKAKKLKKKLLSSMTSLAHVKRFLQKCTPPLQSLTNTY